MEVELFDTTLRDGTQGGELNLVPEQKRELADILHKFAPEMIIEVSYAEGDLNPGEVYDIVRGNSKSIKDVISTFGSTHKPRRTVNKCTNIRSMIETKAKIVTIFGKTWLQHVHGLGFTEKDYLENIENTVAYLLKNGVERVIYDAEHFFWGLRENPEFAKATIKSAIRGGSDTIVLCDTKGGMLPTDIMGAVNSLDSLINKYDDIIWGIHTHNDTGCAVANACTFVDVMKEKGVKKVQVQGTINGYGERCGNSDLITIIGNLIDKRGVKFNIDPKQLKSFAHKVARITGVPLNPKNPYVGDEAFGHKGGIHIYSQKRRLEYNHTDPEIWGNNETYLITSMSGNEMLADLAAHFGYKVDKKHKKIIQLSNRIKKLEKDGFKIHYQPSEHLLLVHSVFASDDYRFKLDEWETKSELIKINNRYVRRSQTVLTAMQQEDSMIKPAEVVSKSLMGPVDSQFKAVQKMLSKDNKDVNNINLIDFNVDITRYTKDMGSESAVIAYITYKDNGRVWTTQYVSENILEATLGAIVKGFKYHDLITNVEQYKKAA